MEGAADLRASPSQRLMVLSDDPVEEQMRELAVEEEQLRSQIEHLCGAELFARCVTHLVRRCDARRLLHRPAPVPTSSLPTRSLAGGESVRRSFTRCDIRDTPPPRASSGSQTPLPVSAPGTKHAAAPAHNLIVPSPIVAVLSARLR
eukprot:COSAG01_NODE_3317_length_6273_cov_4.748461_1_plen_147_part_00